MFTPALLSWVLVASGLLLWLSRLGRRLHTRTALPPGPPRLPFLGSVLASQKGSPVDYLHKLSQKYGDLVCLDILGQPIVILGWATAANDLLDKRWANYSNRPPSAMAELTGCSSWLILLQSCGPLWHEGRKLIHRYFQGRNDRVQLQGISEKHTRALLHNLLRKPERFFDHIKFAICATLVEMTYGIELSSSQDEVAVLEYESIHAISDSFYPGRYLVELFPVLRHLPKWLPGITFHHVAAKYKEVYHLARNKPFSESLISQRNGNAKECFVSTTLSGSGQTKENEKLSEATLSLVRDTAAVVYIGGADSVVSTLHIFVLAMVLNPRSQEAAHTELDKVVGSGRLPVISDVAAGSLPYVEALMLEVLRWKPVAPFSFVHWSTEDDVYRGKLIPKGSYVMTSIQAMSQDPLNYQHPERFEPERFLKDGKLNPDILDPRSYVFGYGRRICPGQQLAQNQLLLMIATILHAFVIEPSLDAEGAPVYPSDEMEFSGILISPRPFECKFTPRSHVTETLILENSHDMGAI